MQRDSVKGEKGYVPPAATGVCPSTRSVRRGSRVKFCCELLNSLALQWRSLRCHPLSRVTESVFFGSVLSARAGFNLERDRTGSTYSGQKEEEDNEEKGDVARLS